MLLTLYKVQLLLSKIAGLLANCKIGLIKNNFIKLFLRSYAVNMQEAIQEDPLSYNSFNDFFTRRLNPNARHISTTAEIISPVDGTVHEFGDNEQNIVAKDHGYSLASLCGNDPRCNNFESGKHIVLYLAPHNYHRVHVPLDCVLNDMLYVPGRLFSVDPKKKNFDNSIFAANERLVCFCDSNYGEFAIIMVAAMIVGQIETSLSGLITPPHSQSIKHHNYKGGVNLKKGDEFGCFRLGSTVILLFKEKVNFVPGIMPGGIVNMGQNLARIS